ncbi:hypothetical protein MW7_016705 [Imbroritus primus]|uniref:Uncharacterized protein n=1 Tax=Imbroritus primus TaxID=3058603 RepID=A0ACD3SKJ3_9BURK|nr:hypothetical protein MW7_016705 [Burkholderiaceae bacterium PBA]
MTTIGASPHPASQPDSGTPKRNSDVADLPPAARPAVDNGQYAAPAPAARTAFQRDVLTVLPTLRQPVPMPLAGQDAVCQAAETDRDAVALRTEVSTVNGGSGLLSRFASPLRRVLMRDNASETLPRVLVEAPALPVPDMLQSVPSPAAMAALLAHLPTMPRQTGRRPRRAIGDPERDVRADEEAEQAEAERQAALARTRVSRRV